MSDPIAQPAVPPPRRPGDVELWPTRRAVPLIAARRGIEPESARKWLHRHVKPDSREAGRDGENLWPIARVRQLLSDAESEFTRR